MKVTIMPPYNTMAVGVLFQYYQEAGIDPRGSYKTHLEDAKKFLQTAQLPREDFAQLDTGMFYEKGVSLSFECSDSKVELIVGFDNFCAAIYDAVTGKQPQFLNMEPVKRSTIPTLRAFEKNWTGDSSIIPTNYSMLW